MGIAEGMGKRNPHQEPDHGECKSQKICFKNNQKKLITDAVKFPDFLSIYEEVNIMTLRINEWKEVCMMAEKRCYTVAELQEILGVSRPTVYSLLKRNEFRWIQLDGGKYRISKKSFDDWLDKQPSEE